MQPDNTKTKKTEFLSAIGLLVTTVIWGWGFVFVRMALDAGVSTAGVMLGRFAIASVAMGIVFHRPIRQNYARGQWKSGLVIGVLLFTAFYVQTIGMNHTTPANSAFITAMYVVLVPLLMWVVTKKRPPAVIFIACLLSMAGVGILSITPGQGLSVGFGDAITLLSALLFAAHIVATGMLARTIQFMVLVYMQITVAALCSLGAFVITDRNFLAFLNWKAFAPLLYLGILSTFVCYFLQTYAQRFMSPAKAGIFLATESLFGAVFSMLVGYDQPSLRMVVGGLVVFLSVILPDVWVARQQRRQAPKG